MWPFGNCKAPCTIVSVKNKKSSECKKEEKMSKINISIKSVSKKRISAKDIPNCTYFTKYF